MNIIYALLSFLYDFISSVETSRANYQKCWLSIFHSIKVNGDEGFKNDNTRHDKRSPYDSCDAFSMFSIVKWLCVLEIFPHVSEHVFFSSLPLVGISVQLLKIKPVFNVPCCNKKVLHLVAQYSYIKTSDIDMLCNFEIWLSNFK